MIRRLVIRSVGAFLTAQVVVIGALAATDAWRKRTHPQGVFPRARPGPVMVGTSEVQLFTDGDDLYRAMVEAIRHARQRILFQTYIWKDDAWGTRFKEELERAARRGVTVHVIFDGFANLVVPRRFKRFAPALHVLTYPLLPWPWHPLHLRSYARDHRKILVADGHTAFVGGYNIGSLYAAEWRV